MLRRRWDDLRPQAWKNGGGSTRDVVARPEAATLADFDWRVSIAEVGQDGPFSAFPGIDRVIMLLEGDEMVLAVNGATHRLGRLDTLAFAGEDDTTCQVPSGGTRDLNLMTRRGRAAGSLRAVEVAGAYEAATGDDGALVLVVLTDGLALEPADASEPVPLQALDSVIEDASGARIRVTGTGTLVELKIVTELVAAPA